MPELQTFILYHSSSYFLNRHVRHQRFVGRTGLYAVSFAMQKDAATIPHAT